MKRIVIDIFPVEMMPVANFVNLRSLCYQLAEDQEKPSLVAAETKTKGKPVVRQNSSRTLL